MVWFGWSPLQLFMRFLGNRRPTAGLVWLEPAGPYNRVGEVPEHVEGFVLDKNEVAERYAYDAANKDAPVKRKKKEEDE